MLGPYDAEAAQPQSPLHENYAVAPFPRLWGEEASFVDGHAWIVPAAERSPAERAAMARFPGFLARYNFDWSPAAQLPAFAQVVESPAFRALPHRADIAALARTGKQLPDYVEPKNAVQGLIGEELEAAITGAKPVDAALKDAERRVRRLCAQMM